MVNGETIWANLLTRQKSILRGLNAHQDLHYGITLTTDEVMELRKMSDLNEAKALQYFWFCSPGVRPELAGVMHALTGREGLPAESMMEGLLIKLLVPSMYPSRMATARHSGRCYRQLFRRLEACRVVGVEECGA